MNEIGSLLEILGSLGFFIFGMKTMSDGVQKAAGNQMREILRTMTQNRFLGVFTGFLITAIVQSSSATTVMTVSFVNAGLLSLVESAGIMMGANVGTTITGWIVSMLGFKIHLSLYSIPLFAFGVPMLFSNKGNTKYWGEFIIGFAMLFLALSYLKESVPDIRSNQHILEFLKGYTSYGIFSRILFVIIGTLITVIVQSSSAAMAITLTMCAQGWLTFDVAAAMVLGENIGTTITAEIASLIGNVNAKRSARIHSLFNIIGVTWMILLMPIFLRGLQFILTHLMGIEDGFTNPEDMPIALSAFHTVFNLSNVFLLIGFVPMLVRIAKWSVPSKGGDKKSTLKFIGGSMRTPELALNELQKVTSNFADLLIKMSSNVRHLMATKDGSNHNSLLKKIRKHEQITDDIELEIVEYITELNKQEITDYTSKKLSNYLNIANDLERIGDIYFQISKSLEQKFNERQYFLPEQRNGIYTLLNLVDRALLEMFTNLNMAAPEDVDITQASNIESQINKTRSQLRKDNNLRIGEELYDVRTAILYMNIVTRLERIGDHIFDVNQTIIGKP